MTGSFATAATTGTPPNDELVIYRGATLFDGTVTSSESGMTVVVKGQRIQQIVADAKLDPEVLQKARVIDLRGQFLMPA
jgi:imidazolonepropionase-like amidohydrolase